jgi:MOSC domain-containing protein YiiM
LPPESRVGEYLRVPSHIVSVNLAVPATVPWKGREVPTGIDKRPVDRPIDVLPGGVVGDTVADPSVHGGPDKAVYAYPREHYDWWREQPGGLPAGSDGWGLFGENLTTEGLTEDAFFIGDQFEVGTALLEVAQPRQPCFKFVHRMGAPDAARLMIDSGRSGVYLRVIRAGRIAAGDEMVLVHRHPQQVSVRELSHLLARGRGEEARLREILDVGPLTDSWRRRVLAMLEAMRTGA